MWNNCGVDKMVDILKWFGVGGNKPESKKVPEDFDLKHSNVCIICGKEVDAHNAVPIKEDFIIKGIRFIKQKTGTIRNNKLYVCEDCFEEYKKERKSFINGVFLWTILIGVLFFILLIMPLVANKPFNISSIIGITFGALLFWLMAMVMQLYKYRPATEYPVDEFKKHISSDVKTKAGKAKKSTKKIKKRKR